MPLRTPITSPGLYCIIDILAGACPPPIERIVRKIINEGKRNKSKIEFDNSYFAIDDDIERLRQTNFGLKDSELAKHKNYLESKYPLLERLSNDLYLHLKIANGLYPQCETELIERRIHQKYAAGACYGILSLLERIFNHIGVSRDKHTNEIEHLRKELSSIKAWRDSDKKRFKF